MIDDLYISESQEQFSLGEPAVVPVVPVVPIPWVAMFVVAAMAAMIVLAPIGRLIGVRDWMLLIGVGVVIGVGLPVWIRSQRGGFGKGANVDGGAMVLPRGLPDARVHLIAPAAMVSKMAEISVDPFEPRIFRVHGAVRGQRWQRWTLTIAACVVGLVGSVMLRRYGGGLGIGGPGAGGWVPTFFDWQVGIGAGTLPYLLLWPTYYRVVPGRLDVLEFGMLGAGKPTVRKYALRTARMRVSVRGGMAMIGKGKDVRVDVVYQGTPRGKMEWAKAMVEGALCEHEAPDVGDEGLVG